mgnify:CR=1 FL=1
MADLKATATPAKPKRNGLMPTTTIGKFKNYGDWRRHDAKTRGIEFVPGPYDAQTHKDVMNLEEVLEYMRDCTGHNWTKLGEIPDWANELMRNPPAWAKPAIDAASAKYD